MINGAEGGGEEKYCNNDYRFGITNGLLYILFHGIQKTIGLRMIVVGQADCDSES